MEVPGLAQVQVPASVSAIPASVPALVTTVKKGLSSTVKKGSKEHEL